MISKYELAKDALNFAQGHISGIKVACVLYAYSPKLGYEKLFTGVNIEISPGSQANIHAERLALLKAISEGFTKPKECFIVSTSELHSAAMCGYCMQDYTYLNPECKIYVYNNDGEEIIKTTVRERQGKFGYFSRSRVA